MIANSFARSVSNELKVFIQNSGFVLNGELVETRFYFEVSLKYEEQFSGARFDVSI